ncbi:alpha-amylase family glycosyl hydrolase, partial [Microbulbifer halophilus]
MTQTSGELPIEEIVRRKVCGHLAAIYPDRDREEIARELLRAMRLDEDCQTPQSHRNLWDQTDMVVITYADTILSGDRRPLQALHHFLKEHFTMLINSVHILPFFPYSSDDGFAVIDYKQVDPALGDWNDILRISTDFHLMADLVINHCSSQHRWFVNFQEGKDPGRDYFLAVDPSENL